MDLTAAHVTPNWISGALERLAVLVDGTTAYGPLPPSANMMLVGGASVSVALLLLFCVPIGGRHVPEAACPASQTHRTLYLEHGAEGVLHADPHCHLEIVTCPSCVLAFNLSDSGESRSAAANSTRCLQLAELWEPPHEPLLQRPGVCGSYVSRTRSVSVRAIADKLVLRYLAQRNRVSITGAPGTTGRLVSPYFPHPYLHDLNVEYTITCLTDACVVSLLFTDFQLAPSSIVELFDWNGARLDVVTGAHFRPPPVITSGPRLVLRFYANGGNGAGYTATYTLHDVSLAGQDAVPSLPLTDCGGHVDDLGGAITMMQMTRAGDDVVSHYDCMWIVRPSKNAVPRLHFSTHVYLKVLEFSGMGIGSRLSVHQGVTSDGRLLELLKASDDNSSLQEDAPFNPREHVTPVSVGFYVRLRGYFGPSSRLAVAYAAFSYARGDVHCSAGGEHLCDNRRCLARPLLCDGFDQCGDGTDEPASCYGVAPSAEDKPASGDRPSSWYSRPDQPNYLFPRVDPYADLRTATLIFVASSLGLVALVCALFVLLYRINSRSTSSSSGSPMRRQHTQRGTSPRRDSQVTHIMAAIDTLLDEESPPDADSLADEPPTYEPPPGYDECMSKAVAVKRETRRPARSRNRRKYRSRAGGRRRSVTPPPSYEAGSRGRRRWRSHGELLAGRVAVSRVCSLLTARCDTASDSELLNMHEAPADTGPCANQLKQNKFYTS